MVRIRKFYFFHSVGTFLKWFYLVFKSNRVGDAPLLRDLRKTHVKSQGVKLRIENTTTDTSLVSVMINTRQRLTQ